MPGSNIKPQGGPIRHRDILIAVGLNELESGQVFPALIRSSSTKPLRVFLQSGTGDNNNRSGNWFLSNQQMASSLEFKGYDFKAVWGEGGHNYEHGGAIFPDTLRWLWRDYDAKQ